MTASFAIHFESHAVCECDLIEGVVCIEDWRFGFSGDFCLSIELRLRSDFLLVAGIGIDNRRVVVDDDGVGLEWIAVAVRYLRCTLSSNFGAVKVEGDGSALQRFEPMD